MPTTSSRRTVLKTPRDLQLLLPSLKNLLFKRRDLETTIATFYAEEDWTFSLQQNKTAQSRTDENAMLLFIGKKLLPFPTTPGIEKKSKKSSQRPSYVQPVSTVTDWTRNSPDKLTQPRFDPTTP